MSMGNAETDSTPITEPNTQGEPIAVAKGEIVPRQRSTIEFPYTPLSEAVEIAQKVHDQVGTAECSDQQLAAWLNMSPKSSTYRVRVSSTKMFGLLLQGTKDDYVLSDLGKRIVDPTRQREAAVEAFLSVGLYQAVFRHYDGGVLPPVAALERQIVTLGVAEKQKARARSAMERSAEYAGFFEQGKSRMVKPGIKPGDPPLVDRPPPPTGGGGGDGGGTGGERQHDPMIIGLINRLPKSEASWTLQDRQRWLATAAQVFDFIYGDAEEGKIVVAIEEPTRG